MLTILVYHQICNPKVQGSLDIFHRHLSYLVNKCNIVTPCDKLLSGTSNVCLTFDDAYYEFYHYVFPKLKEYRIKAILGIPAGWIFENTNVPFEKRLSLSFPNIMEPAWQDSHAPLCTYGELSEMIQSGYVIPAVHGYYHLNLAAKHLTDEDIRHEVEFAKQVLENRFKMQINKFIYPYGGTLKRVTNYVKSIYEHSFRIGSAFNFGWQTKKDLCRIDADTFFRNRVYFNKYEYFKYSVKSCLNVFR